jgi:hypothetical protein
MSTWELSLETLYVLPFSSTTLESALFLSLIKPPFFLVDGTKSLVFLFLLSHTSFVLFPQKTWSCYLCAPLLQDYSGQSHLTVSLLLGGTSLFRLVTALASCDDLVFISLS